MYITNFIYYKLNRFYELSLQFKMVIWRHLEYLGPRNSCRFWKQIIFETLIRRSMLNFIFLLCIFIILWKKTIMGNGSRTPSWMSYSQQELEIQATDESSRTLIGRTMGGICLISRLYYEIYRFYGKNNNSKWLPDAILNIFVCAIAVDPGKYTPIKDLYMKVCAKFQLCKVIFKRNH